MFTPPLWWLVISAICFILVILLIVGTAVGAIIAWAKVSPLLSEVQKQVKEIGSKTTDIATTARDTVETVHDRTEQILGTAQHASATATRRIGAASAALTVVFVGARIATFVRSLLSKRETRRHATA